MAKTDFIIWLEGVKDKYAEGSSVKLAALLGLKGRGTIGEWERKNSAPSARSCKLLASLTGEDWRWIAALAGSALRHGSGNRRDDRDDAELPKLSPEIDPLDRIFWPPVYPDNSCTGCHQDRVMRTEHEDRQEVCQVFTTNGLPGLCEPWSAAAVVRMARLLAGIEDE